MFSLRLFRLRSGQRLGAGFMDNGNNKREDWAEILTLYALFFYFSNNNHKEVHHEQLHLHLRG